MKSSGNRLLTRLIVEVNIVINDCESKKRRSSIELFLVVLGSTDKGKTVGAVKLLKLDINNMTWEEIEDLKDTVLSVELIYGSPMFYSPAITSSEFGGTNHVSTWALLECTRLESDRVLVGCKQEKEGHKEDGIVVRSVKGNHELSPLPYVGNDTSSKCAECNSYDSSLLFICNTSKASLLASSVRLFNAKQKEKFDFSSTCLALSRH
ncbi:hypothetical protein Tco_0766468 [Tanacetum coccineum]